MPKAVLSDSEDDIIPPSRVPAEASDDDEEMADAGAGAQHEDSEEDEEENDPEEFVVENIEKHKWVGKELYVYVKWKGYDEEADKTWEPESNCAGAQEVLDEYFERIGGRPSPSSTSKARSRRSTGTPGSTKSKSKSVGASPVKFKKRHETPEEEEKWSPPKGHWEDEIAAIDTIEKNEKGLQCYVQWNNGHKSQHPISVLYKKCPQRMLAFYESHLVFKETDVVDDEGDSPTVTRRMVKRN